MMISFNFSHWQKAKLINISYSIVLLLMVFGKAFAVDPAVIMAADPCSDPRHPGPGSILTYNALRAPGRHMVIFNTLRGVSNIRVNGREYQIDYSTEMRNAANAFQEIFPSVHMEVRDTGSEHADVILTASSSMPPPYAGRLRNFVYGFPANSRFYHTEGGNGHIPGYVPGLGGIVIDAHFFSGPYIENLLNQERVALYIDTPEGASGTEFLIHLFYRYCFMRAILEYSYFISSELPSRPRNAVTFWPENQNEAIYNPPIVSSHDFYSYLEMRYKYYGSKVGSLGNITPNGREWGTFMYSNLNVPKAG